MSDLILVVSADCTLFDRARAHFARLGVVFREVDLEEEEAGKLTLLGIPVVFFPARGIAGRRRLRLRLRAHQERTT